jgi:hypothetical protein
MGSRIAHAGGPFPVDITDDGTTVILIPRYSVAVTVASNRADLMSISRPLW